MRRAAADAGFFETLVGDGRALLTLTALALLFAGSFALFQSASGQFLPHDIAFLGDSAGQLGALAEGRVRNFMFHDRVAFGGSILAIGWLYLWLIEFPLREGRTWAWWVLAASGALGFGSFLAYLGYGYLDTWHAVGTLALIPIFTAGMARTYPLVPHRRPWAEIFQPGVKLRWRSRRGVGRLLLLATGAGMVLGGAIILTVGMTSVFVPQDLSYIGLHPADLQAANPRLIPLIAHDRAGFGGGICSCGLLVLGCVWCGRPSRALHQALALAGTAGFGAALGVHFCIGYTDFSHLAPAFAGLALYLGGLGLEVGASGRVSPAPGNLADVP